MMVALENIKAGFQAFWKRIATPVKVALIAVPCSLVVILAVLLFSGNEKFVTICEDIEDRNVVFSFVDSLEQADISYELGDRGHSVSVPFKDLSEAANILSATVEKGHKDGDSAESDFFSNSLFNPSLRNGNSELRIRERDLSRNIGCYKGVRNARVMITPPDSRLFAKKEHKEACASVFLELSGSQPVSMCRISGIKDLVAASYQGLSKDKVNITDSMGTDYTMLAQNLGDKEDEALRIEQERAECLIQEKVERHLSVMFGKNNVSVVASMAYVRDGKSRKAKVENLCISVLVNKGSKGLDKLTPEMHSSIIDNISNVARVDHHRGDTVSVKIVPFDRTEDSGPEVCELSSVSSRDTGKLSGGADFLKKSEVSAPDGFKPDAITLSTSNFFGTTRRAPFNLPGWFVLSLISVALFCVMIFIVRRGAAEGAFDDDLWHPSANLHFYDGEGAYCDMSDFSVHNGSDDRLYREEFVSRTASEDPMVIASLIRRNECIKNSDW
jgi:flagellar biosynthesis/type III secretory pathway M-ring protein FliF/YscJ